MEITVVGLKQFYNIHVRIYSQAIFNSHLVASQPPVLSKTPMLHILGFYVIYIYFLFCVYYIYK